MPKFLTAIEREVLEREHRKEKNGKKRDRLKAILGHDDDLSYASMAAHLFVDEATVRRHVDEYKKRRKKGNDSGGSDGQLGDEQLLDFQGKLGSTDVPNVSKAIAMAFELYGVVYSESGMTALLHKLNFSYTKPASVPAKADPAAQEAWLAEFLLFLKDLPSGDRVFYFDAFHPTINTKISHGWRLKGVSEAIQSTGAKTRVNVVGSLDVKTLNMVATFPKWVDSESVEEHFKELRRQYPKSLHSTIHLVLDQGPYCKSKATLEAAQKWGIELKFLPPYSPNLNLIERAWKVVNERVRNNVYFADAKEFTSAIKDFLLVEWKTLRKSLTSRFALNFQILKPVF